MNNTRISPLFKRLRRKLRLKKEPSQEQDEPVPQNAFHSSPLVEAALAPGHHFATNHHPSQQTPISTQQTTAQQTTISSQQTTISSQQTTAQQTIAQQTTAQQTTISTQQTTTAQPKPSSGSVTLAERVRYQKMVLGMSDAQIARALPPGEYTIVSPPSMPPSGPGHLAYAYYESA